MARNGCFSPKHGKTFAQLAKDEGREASGPSLSDVPDYDDPEIDTLLTHLKAAMGGHTITGEPLGKDPVTGLVSHEANLRLQAEATSRYMALREQVDAARSRREWEAQQARDRAIAESRVEVEVSLAAVEADKVRLAENEARARFVIEQQRVDVEKGRLLIEAIKAASGSPEVTAAFGPLLQQLGAKLIGTDAVEEVTAGLRLLEATEVPQGKKEPQGS